MATVAVSACEENGVEPPMLRFGQSGQLVVEVVTPQQHLPSPGMGELRQTLTWRSTGAWQLFESIAYRGLVGSETTTPSPGDPGAFTSSYATLITQIHGAQSGLDLFIDLLDPNLDPTCDPEEGETRETNRTRVTLRIQDEIRGEERNWTRCARGPLGSLDPAGSGPDPNAARVIQVSRLVHDRTLGDSATSAYHNSIPFATLYKGTQPGERGLVSRAFFGGPAAGDAPAGWGDFWRDHAGGASPPHIDWSADMVVVAADGARQEAGSILEIRKIVPTEGAIIQLVEFAPGDFCSPAAVVETPFHVVIAPRTGSAIQFTEVALERVPCGL